MRLIFSKVFLRLLQRAASHIHMGNCSMTNSLLISLGRGVARTSIRIKKRAPLIFWPFTFLYYHNCYYKSFGKSDLVGAYKSRLTSYLILMDKLWDCEFRREVERYLRLCNLHFDVFGLIEECDLILSTSAQDRVKHIISHPIYFNFPRGQSAKGVSSIVYGPLAKPSESTKYTTAHDVAVFIKPNKEFLETAGDSASLRYGYCNMEDFDKLKANLESMLALGELDMVLTPRNDFYNYPWALPVVRFPVNFAFHSSFALISISCSLLAYGKSMVRLEGFDFYYSGTIYGRSDYHSSLKTNGSQEVDVGKFLLSISRHDLLINYLIIKELVDKGLVQPDDGLKAALTNHPFVYLSVIERKYTPSCR